MNGDQSLRAPVLPGFAGYANLDARRRSDQQVRAWVGETLTDLAERIPVAAVQKQFDTLLMRCEFTDQHVVHALENQRFAQPEMVARMEEADRRLVELANHGRTIGPEELPALLDDLQRAFDQRAAVIESVKKI